MSVLWAFVVLVSIHIGGVHGIPDLQLNLPNPPDIISPATHLQSPNFITLPRNNQKLLNPSVPVFPPKLPSLNEKKSNKDTPVTSEPHCTASVWSYTSGTKINEYLNNSVTEAVNELSKCSDVSLGGMLMPFLSMVDIESILGKGGLPGLDSLPVSPDNLLDLLKLQCLSSLPTANLVGTISGPLPTENGQLPDNGGLNDLTSGSGLLLPDTKNLLPLPSSGNKNEERKESDKSEDPASIKNPASSVGSAISDKGTDDIKGLADDLKFHATNVVIKDMSTKMEGNFIDVTAHISADISVPSTLTGLVAQIVGFQMDGVANIKLSVAANDSICTKFISEEKSIQVEDMKMKLLDVLKKQEKIIPLPVPSSLVSGLITLKMDFSKEECPIDFPNPWCKNAIVPDKQDLFKYTFKSCSFISESLVCDYCAEINYNDKSVPVAGGESSNSQAGTDAALEWHHHLVKAAITHTMKKVSVKTNDMVLQITTVKYKLSDPKLELYLQTNVKQNDVKMGEIKYKLVFSHNGMIDGRNHLSGSMNLISSEYKLEAENDNIKEMAKQLPMKVMTLLNDDLQHINMPYSPMFDSLKGSSVHADAQGNLIASQSNQPETRRNFSSLNQKSSARLPSPE